MPDPTPETLRKLLARVEDVRRHERHRNHGETHYWLAQWRSIAEAFAGLLDTAPPAERQPSLRDLRALVVALPRTSVLVLGPINVRVEMVRLDDVLRVLGDE